jgi:lipocalin
MEAAVKPNLWIRNVSDAKSASRSLYDTMFSLSDKDYKYALCSGDSLDYLWILSREKQFLIQLRRRI